MDNRNERVVVSHAGLAPWSLLFVDDARSAPVIAQTLAGLCQRHAGAIYAYLRRRGHAPDDAVRLLHAFVGTQARPALPATSFRQWLPTALDAFLAHPAATAPSPALALPPTAELEQDSADAAALAPHADAPTAFAADFARGMLANARARLRLEAAQADRAGWYDHLAPWLAADPPPDQVALLTASHRLTERALAIALKRLRQRFRELVDAELAATVADPDALEGERIALHAALAGAAR
jgi:RNA polymerase sigma-70 factor (ECF subfamily)